MLKKNPEKQRRNKGFKPGFKARHTSLSFIMGGTARLSGPQAQVTMFSEHQGDQASPPKEAASPTARGAAWGPAHPPPSNVCCPLESSSASPDPTGFPAPPPAPLCLPHLGVGDSNWAVPGLGTARLERQSWAPASDGSIALEVASGMSLPSSGLSFPTCKRTNIHTRVCVTTDTHSRFSSCGCPGLGPHGE